MKPTIFALKRAHQATRKALDDGLACYDLTSAQLDVLICLHSRGEVEQRDLQASLGVTSATLTRLLDGMVARALVERRPSAADARVNLIATTAKGRALLGELLAQEEAAFVARFAAGFSAAELTLLTNWLNRIALNMGDT